ncbi:CatB-related O-acetyltransferase [Seonamhaeicola sediminis]|uniref:CatB-related O-acetyltransferase n=1 Tax=Seonamhaeicola sediminis TaxID=2528206 RepID=A0A562YH36_9FLAO|nr:CatB-related O-acetyltransferase [Seonamhaeicola sediminis]TWO34376.1 CatB-related O-acetyltransferase [Seonamhaeicola sediminis]
MIIRKAIEKLMSYTAIDKLRMADNEIKSIAFLFYEDQQVFTNYRNICKSYRYLMSLIRSDFEVVEFNLKDKLISQEDVVDFDFVLVADGINGFSDIYVRKNLKVDIPFGIITSDSSPKKRKALFFYDVVWFQSFEFQNQLFNHPNLFHVCLKETEDICSPNWDDNYFRNQIRKGINSVVKDSARISNRMKSMKRLKVGLNSFYNSNFQIIGSEAFVEIGSFCSFGNNIKIYTTNHDTNYLTTQGYIYRKYFNRDHPGEFRKNPSLARTKGPVIIKNDVWIGDDVKIMSGVTIGNGACIAAGSIVTSDVEDYSIVGGVPAKHLKARFDIHIIEFLLSLKWWDWPDRMIKMNEEFFILDLNSIDEVDEIKINYL